MISTRNGPQVGSVDLKEIAMAHVGSAGEAAVDYMPATTRRPKIARELAPAVHLLKAKVNKVLAGEACLGERPSEARPSRSRGFGPTGSNV